MDNDYRILQSLDRILRVLDDIRDRLPPQPAVSQTVTLTSMNWCPVCGNAFHGTMPCPGLTATSIKDAEGSQS